MAPAPQILSGALDRRITIQRATETRSATGDVVQAWATVATVSAAIRYGRGYEQTEGPGLQARHLDSFRIRWRNDVTAKHRILFTPSRDADVVIYNILNVIELGRREGLMIDVRAKVT